MKLKGFTDFKHSGGRLMIGVYVKLWEQEELPNYTVSQNRKQKDFCFVYTHAKLLRSDILFIKLFSFFPSKFLLNVFWLLALQWNGKLSRMHPSFPQKCLEKAPATQSV